MFSTESIVESRHLLTSSGIIQTSPLREKRKKKKERKCLALEVQGLQIKINQFPPSWVFFLIVFIGRETEKQRTEFCTYTKSCTCTHIHQAHIFVSVLSQNQWCFLFSNMPEKETISDKGNTRIDTAFLEHSIFLRRLKQCV